MTDNRTYLGKASSVAARYRVYLTTDGFDVDSREQYDIIQRRVLFDDVQLVTLHREPGVFSLAATGVLTLIFATIVITILVYNIDSWVVALIVGALGLPFMIAFILRLVFGYEVITIFGRRSKAVLHFGLKKQRARQTYGKICAAVLEAQRRVSATVPESPAPPLPDLPPSQ